MIEWRGPCARDGRGHPEPVNSPRVLARCLLLVGLGLTFALSPAARAAEEPPHFKDGEFHPAGLGPREPQLRVDYPDAARVRGVAHGFAEVSVLIDADGKPLDFLVTGESDSAFGRQFVDYLETRAFQAATLQGVPVPARCAFTYRFEAGDKTGMSAFEASESRSSMGKAKASRAAVTESKLDHRLQVLEGAVPTQPKGFAAPAGPVKVFVTFFIDETGQVRVPNVESASSPQLLPPVIAALSTWKFKPPTVGGKPAIVFVGRTLPVAPAP
jgi:hypothetical protein